MNELLFSIDLPSVLCDSIIPFAGVLIEMEWLFDRSIE